MREIKFRAWSRKLQEFITDWDDGEYSEVVFRKGNTIITQTDLVDDMRNGEHYQFDEYKDYVVDGKTVILEQYTGLKDKNGIEIYEGDIVKSKMMNFVKAQVVFYSNSWCLDVPNSGREGWIENILSDSIMEIVGNIHENKKILGMI